MPNKSKRETKVKVQDLPKGQKHLSKKEQKEVKGGTLGGLAKGVAKVGLGVASAPQGTSATGDSSLSADLETNPEAQAG